MLSLAGKTPEELMKEEEVALLAPSYRERCEIDFSLLLEISQKTILNAFECGRSSVVEHHVANVRVVSSNLIARYLIHRIPEYSSVTN